MMQVIKLASSTEFATKIQKVSDFCAEVIHFKLEALSVPSFFIVFPARYPICAIVTSPCIIIDN